MLWRSTRHLLYDPKINRSHDNLARRYEAVIQAPAADSVHLRHLAGLPSLAAMDEGPLVWCVRIAGQRRPRAPEGRAVTGN
jgi:hypothetical protein